MFNFSHIRGCLRAGAKALVLSAFLTVSAFAIEMPEHGPVAVPEIEIVNENESLFGNLKPNAIFENVTQERVSLNNQIGVRITVKFRIQNALKVPCRLLAFFYFENNEPMYSDGTKNYTAKDGTAYVATNFTPGFEDAKYDKVQLFMPYSILGFDPEPGETPIRYRLIIRDNTTVEVARTPSYSWFINFN